VKATGSGVTQLKSKTKALLKILTKSFDQQFKGNVETNQYQSDASGKNRKRSFSFVSKLLEQNTS
jgi:hypothetical protein